MSNGNRVEEVANALKPWLWLLLVVSTAFGQPQADQPKTENYRIAYVDGAFTFTEASALSYSPRLKKTVPGFRAVVKNETGCAWDEVIFGVRVYLEGGLRQDFALGEIRSFQNQASLELNDALNHAAFDQSNFAKFEIYVRSAARSRTVTTKLYSGESPRKGGKPAKKAKAAKKASGKATSEKPSERSNKKAEVIALMARAKGATLTEIMEATGWQRHTVRGFVSILGSKGGQSIESTKNAGGERTYKITK